MWPTIFIFLVAYSHAKSITPPEEADLVKISNTCITVKEYQELAGNFTTVVIIQMYTAAEMLGPAIADIGLEELRYAIGFPLVRPWKPFVPENMHTEAEKAAVSTIEEYYDLMEPHYYDPSEDWFDGQKMKKVMAKFVAFLDRRFPEIRNYYRKNLKTSLGNRKVDRDTVDEMFEKLWEITKKVKEAQSKSYSKCSRDDLSTESLMKVPLTEKMSNKEAEGKKDMKTV
uniref:Uncharacterized protein n=1 Tax=Caenorhabditis tropicalis TaxID=1561998 RepID=A0A1I7TI85_9PELO